MYINPGALSMLSLNVSEILHGQIWRLVTWIIYPPSTSSALWFVIAILFFYYPISASLERTWGSFRFTVYILSGMIFTVISAFILYFITGGVLDAYLNGSQFSTYLTLPSDPDQVEVECDCIFCSCGILYCHIFDRMSMVYCTADHRILTELYYFLPWYKKS